MPPPNSTKPTANQEIAALVSRLLAHYWTADDSPVARQAQIEDWIGDLREFGPAIVADALREWRRKPNQRRPLPGDIRAICTETAKLRSERPALPGPTDMGEYARSVGFANNAERMAQIRRDNDRTDYLNSAANGERLAKIQAEIAGLKPARQHAATALGVTARERTADELRAGRIAPGIEKRQAAE